MKNIILFLLAFLPVMANAQDYIKEGTAWNCIVNGSHAPSVYVSATEEIAGDTIINGITASKVYYSSETSSRQLTAIIRTEESKVYLWHHASNQWLLAYDFGLEVGKGCYVGHLNNSLQKNDSGRITYIRCTGKDTVTLYDESTGNPVEVPVLYVEEYRSDECEGDCSTGTLLVGIGTTKGLLWNNRFGVDGGSSTLVSVSCDDMQISVSSPTKIVSVDSDTTATDDKVYNLSGIQSTEQKSGNIYIINRKKVLVR